MKTQEDKEETLYIKEEKAVQIDTKKYIQNNTIVVHQSFPMAPELSGGCIGFSGGRSLRQSWKQRMSYFRCAPKCMHQSSTVQSIGYCTKV